MLLFASILALACFSLTIEARGRGTVCPILGPSFPRPTQLNSSKPFQDAIANLDRQIDTALQNGSDIYGHSNFTSQTFSLSVYSTLDDGLLWQRHYTNPSVANSPVGVHQVDANTVYRIGSVSKLLTMYISLILVGDQHLSDPVSKWLPSIVSKNYTNKYGVLPQWDQITIGDLAAHLGGIASDYGADDIEYPGGLKGYPPLPQDRIPTCNYPLGNNISTCTNQELLDGFPSMPAIWADASTPLYSNLGYDIIGLVIESMTGIPLAKSFNDTLVKSLNLTRTFYGTPNNLSYAAIPIGVLHSGWVQNLGPSNADGGNCVSTNDLATIGKSIMNSTLLPPILTRRWLKPVTFTSAPTNFVGRPWEIYRWETPTRLYDIYTKEGGEGQYSTMFGIIPDLNFGFTVLTTGKAYEQGLEETLANIVTEATLPAVEEAARQQAQTNFAGHYTSNNPNSSFVVTTDDQPGLSLTSWTYNGTNALKQLGTNVRLWPNDLYAGTGSQVGFTFSSGALDKPGYIKRPLQLNCESWLGPGDTTFGGVDLGVFVFNVDESSGRAKSVAVPALGVTLARQSSAT